MLNRVAHSTLHPEGGHALNRGSTGVDCALARYPIAPILSHDLLGTLGRRARALGAPGQRRRRCRHLEARHADPTADGLCRDVLRAIGRDGRDRGRSQVAGIGWSHAEAAASLASNGDGSLQGLRDAAILRVMSDTLARSAAGQRAVDGIAGRIGRHSLRVGSARDLAADGG